MGVQVTISTILSGYNVSLIQTNFNAIDTALDDALSRTGAGTNTMEADLDLNGNNLLNVASIGSNLSTYADNAAAVAGGLATNNFYKTSTGEVRVVV